jgi:hypothetical protein
VVVADVLDEQGRETVDRIETAGGEAIYVSADVSRPGMWSDWSGRRLTPSAV